MIENASSLSLQDRVTHLVEDGRTTVFITVLILINAVTLGLETDAEIMASYGPLFYAHFRKVSVCLI